LEALFPGGVIDITELSRIDETLIYIGLSARKVKSIKDLSSHFLDGRLSESGC
jgi:3-methyladenine DNA glycosylase/8-oxoguanine DNA glycosylase